MFSVSAHMYCNMIDFDYEVPDDVVSSLPILKFLC